MVAVVAVVAFFVGAALGMLSMALVIGAER